jgi:hypothetical protein
MDRVRDLVTGFLRGKEPTELSSVEVKALIGALESDLSRMRLEHANARKTAQAFRARAAFEKPAADRLVDDAVARSKKLAEEIERVEDALAGAQERLREALARERREADEAWAAGLRGWMSQRKARHARADALVAELGKLALEEAQAGQVQWHAMPKELRDSMPSRMFNGSALALAVLRRLTAVSGGVIAGERLVQPREFAEVAVEPLDSQAGHYEHIEAGIRSVLGEVKEQDKEPEAAAAA